jgi:hypothetical protein
VRSITFAGRLAGSDGVPAGTAAEGIADTLRVDGADLDTTASTAGDADALSSGDEDMGGSAGATAAAAAGAGIDTTAAPAGAGAAPTATAGRTPLLGPGERHRTTREFAAAGFARALSMSEVLAQVDVGTDFAADSRRRLTREEAKAGVSAMLDTSYFVGCASLPGVVCSTPQAADAPAATTLPPVYVEASHVTVDLDMLMAANELRLSASACNAVHCGRSGNHVEACMPSIVARLRDTVPPSLRRGKVEVTKAGLVRSAIAASRPMSAGAVGDAGSVVGGISMHGPEVLAEVLQDQRAFGAAFTSFMALPCGASAEVCNVYLAVAAGGTVNGLQLFQCFVDTAKHLTGPPPRPAGFAVAPGDTAAGCPTATATPTGLAAAPASASQRAPLAVPTLAATTADQAVDGDGATSVGAGMEGASAPVDVTLGDDLEQMHPDFLEELLTEADRAEAEFASQMAEEGAAPAAVAPPPDLLRPQYGAAVLAQTTVDSRDASITLHCGLLPALAAVALYSIRHKGARLALAASTYGCKAREDSQRTVDMGNAHEWAAAGTEILGSHQSAGQAVAAIGAVLAGDWLRSQPGPVFIIGTGVACTGVVRTATPPAFPLAPPPAFLFFDVDGTSTAGVDTPPGDMYVDRGGTAAGSFVNAYLQRQQPRHGGPGVLHYYAAGLGPAHCPATVVLPVRRMPDVAAVGTAGAAIGGTPTSRALPPPSRPADMGAPTLVEKLASQLGAEWPLSLARAQAYCPLLLRGINEYSNRAGHSELHKLADPGRYLSVVEEAGLPPALLINGQLCKEDLTALERVLAEAWAFVHARGCDARMELAFVARELSADSIDAAMRATQQVACRTLRGLPAATVASYAKLTSLTVTATYRAALEAFMSTARTPAQVDAARTLRNAGAHVAALLSGRRVLHGSTFFHPVAAVTANRPLSLLPPLPDSVCAALGFSRTDVAAQREAAAEATRPVPLRPAGFTLRTAARAGPSAPAAASDPVHGNFVCSGCYKGHATLPELTKHISATAACANHGPIDPRAYEEHLDATFRLLDAFQQKACLELTRVLGNGWVSGQAGAGKSHLLRYLVPVLRHRAGSYDAVCVVAICGLAAHNAGGTTFAHFAGIRASEEESAERWIELAEKTDGAADRWRACQVLVAVRWRVGVHVCACVCLCVTALAHARPTHFTMAACRRRAGCSPTRRWTKLTSSRGTSVATTCRSAACVSL